MSEATATAPAAPVAPAAPIEAGAFSREYVSELRSENASQRVARQAAEAKATEAEAGRAKAETEATERITAAQKTADERIIRAELKASALKAGMVDLDGLKLADLSGIKLDDEGEVVGADALMVELKKSKPYLFGTPSTTSSTTEPPKPSDNSPKKATEMSREEYQAARMKIRQGILPTAKA